MTGPTPAVAAVRAAVRRVLTGQPAGSLVLVGCSGGADSMGLAAAAAFEAPRAGLRAGAVVVDHGLVHPPVAEQVAQWCTGLGLDPVQVHRVTVASAGRGPEAEARAARYRAFEQALTEHDAALLLLGHTLDDQAEQVLLGLARGSGARSLAGMPAARGPYRRPLLTLDRAIVAQSAQDQRLPTWEDPTNTDPRYARNRARHRVLPVLEDELGPGVARALARTATQLAHDADLLDQLAAELLAGTRDDRGDLRVPALAAAPAALRHRALRRAALDAGCPPGRLFHQHVLAMDALVTAWKGQGPVALPRARRLRRHGGMLSFEVADVQEESWTQRTSPGNCHRSS